jgi:hypothetical protein
MRRQQVVGAVRDCSPEPQEREQAPHVWAMVYWYWQACVLHCWERGSCVNWVHIPSASTGGEVIHMQVAVRVCTPASHEAEQADHCEYCQA